MTWKLPEQPECGPGCTCTGIPTVTPEPEPRPAVLRTCGSLGCGSCPPVTKWNQPGGAARNVEQWIEDIDPAPVDDYQAVSNEFHTRKASS